MNLPRILNDAVENMWLAGLASIAPLDAAAVDDEAANNAAWSLVEQFRNRKNPPTVTDHRGL